MAQWADRFLFEAMFYLPILRSFYYPFITSQDELVRVLNRNNMTDFVYLFKLLGMSDLEVFSVKYLEISIVLSHE